MQFSSRTARTRQQTEETIALLWRHMLRAHLTGQQRRAARARTPGDGTVKSALARFPEQVNDLPKRERVEQLTLHYTSPRVRWRLTDIKRFCVLSVPSRFVFQRCFMIVALKTELNHNSAWNSGGCSFPSAPRMTKIRHK